MKNLKGYGPVSAASHDDNDVDLVQHSERLPPGVTTPYHSMLRRNEGY